jgi:hypothetical protein
MVGLYVHGITVPRIGLLGLLWDMASGGSIWIDGSSLLTLLYLRSLLSSDWKLPRVAEPRYRITITILRTFKP